MSTVEQVTDPVAAHGEGPVWFDGWPGLRFVDMLAGDVLEFDPVTDAVTRHHVGPVAAALRPAKDGRCVLALERGFALADQSLSTVEPMGELWSDPGIRMNDGGCDPHGRFYCGSMAYDARAGAGSLYRLAPGGAVTTVLTGVTISNGLAWSPDGARAYYIDTPTQRIDQFDFDGELRERRPLIQIPPEVGAPDGMTVDADGRLWVALWNGGAVHCYSPDGKLAERVKLPVSLVTSCAFGGAELDELFITTSRQGLADGEQPEAGALFRYRPGVRGLPTLTFG